MDTITELHAAPCSLDRGDGRLLQDWTDNASHSLSITATHYNRLEPHGGWSNDFEDSTRNLSATKFVTTGRIRHTGT